jgi:hypothetical protein
MNPSSRRVTGISGIVFVLLAVAVLVLTGDQDFDSSNQSLREFFVDNGRQNQAVAAIVLLPLAAAALLWFIAGLRSLLQADARSGLPSAAALGGGFFAVTFLLGATVSNAATIGLAFTDRYAFDPREARLTLILGIVLMTGALAGAAVLITATSLAGERIGLLPKWFARSGYVVAVLALFSILLFAWPYALVALWILTMSVLLLRGSDQSDQEADAELPGQRAASEPVAERDQQRPATSV